jgi:hypothetical protein
VVLGAQEIYEHAQLLMRECATHIAAMSNREIAKQITAFCTDWALTSKAFTFFHHLCSRSGPLIAEVIEVLKKEPVVEYVVVGVDGTLFHLSESAKTVGGAVKEVVKDARVLLQTLHAEHMATLKPEIMQLRTLFDFTKKGFGEFVNKWIKIDYEHILGIDLFFSRHGLAKIDGFHHDWCKKIEAAGIIKFANKVIYENGCYSAKLVYMGETVKSYATFFPSDWSRKKVVEKIYEAYEYSLRNGAKAEELRNGTLKISGLTKEGITIEMFMTKKGKINTAYPLLK